MTYSSCRPRRGPRPRLRRWDEDTAIAALAEAIERAGRVPLNVHLAYMGAPSAETLRKLFGSRDRALDLAHDHMAAAR